MCPRHWSMVPGALQSKVWRHYRPGQCDDKRPSSDWLAAADKAIRHVREVEEAMFAPDPRTGRVPLHALSVRQPWADLIAMGVKGVENREWNPPPCSTGHLIAIHAGKSLDARSWGDAHAVVARIGAQAICPAVAAFGGEQLRVADKKPLTATRELNRWIESRAQYGAIVAVARIVRVIGSADDPAAGPWFTGPFGWILGDVTPIRPVPATGSQYLWPVRGDALAKVRAAFREARSASGFAPP
jgi:hypothetical protein